MASIFSKIIAGEIPCYRVAEDERFLAFLDISPIKRGHTLVVPKQEIDYIFDLSDIDLAAMIVFAKQVAAAVESVVPCKRIALSVVGLEVPHAHLHLIPLDHVADVNFERPKVSMSREEFVELAGAILRNFTKAVG